MSENKVLRPVAGARVRHPDGQVLAENGDPVAMNPYWRRKLAAGDVVEVVETVKTEAPKPKPAPAARSQTSQE